MSCGEHGAVFYDRIGGEVEVDWASGAVYLGTAEGDNSTVAELSPETAEAIARALLDAAGSSRRGASES